MDPLLDALLHYFGVSRVEADAVLATASPGHALARGWRVALERAKLRAARIPEATREWLEKSLRDLASQRANDDLRARAAEVEAALRLSWVGQVARIPEKRREVSADFRVEEVNVEVYCPQQHQEERRVRDADLAQQLERASEPVRVAIAISHPTTGSGRTVTGDGQIGHDPNSRALAYPANKLIDRLLHKKWDGAQLRESEPNLLWLDLKHGLGLHAIDCVPFRSELSKGTCFIGTHGVWHAFYAHSGAPHFQGRASLEWPAQASTYEQQKDGWFRVMPKVSAAVLSVLDGVLLFENPWAAVPLDDEMRTRFVRLSELRAELSWCGCTESLRQDVGAVLDKIAWLARIGSARSEHR